MGPDPVPIVLSSVMNCQTVIFTITLPLSFKRVKGHIHSLVFYFLYSVLPIDPHYPKTRTQKMIDGPVSEGDQCNHILNAYFGQ